MAIAQQKRCQSNRKVVDPNNNEVDYCAQKCKRCDRWRLWRAKRRK